MPHVEFKPSYAVTFTSEEFRLVTLALAGMLRGPDAVKATQLNTHLCSLRAQTLSHAAANASKAQENAIRVQASTQIVTEAQPLAESPPSGGGQPGRIEETRAPGPEPPR